MKIGIVFAGQGAQYSGMGRDLYETYPQAKEIFDTAGHRIKKWCFEGDEETLKQTHVTQPAIYTTTMAAYNALMAEMASNNLTDRLEVTALAGFSLGEYAALTAAGAIDKIQKGINIVSKRGILMQQAGLDEAGNAKGGMAAGMGNRASVLAAVEEARQDGILEGVNFNSPVQTVVAGDKEALDRFRKAARARRIKAVPLGVSTAFHSPMMIPAAEKLKRILSEAELKAPEQKVYANVTADDMMRNLNDAKPSEYLADMMAKQAMSPVYWEETIRRFETDGVEAIIEVGPGRTLTGLMKKTCPDITALNAGSVESLEETISALMHMTA